MSWQYIKHESDLKILILSTMKQVYVFVRPRRQLLVRVPTPCYFLGIKSCIARTLTSVSDKIYYYNVT